MTQNDVNRAVARATGETVRTIAQLGFGIADQDLVDHDREPYGFDPEGKTLDCDAFGTRMQPWYRSSRPLYVTGLVSSPEGDRRAEET